MGGIAQLRGRPRSHVLTTRSRGKNRTRLNRGERQKTCRSVLDKGYPGGTAKKKGKHACSAFLKLRCKGRISEVILAKRNSKKGGKGRGVHRRQ